MDGKSRHRRSHFLSLQTPFPWTCSAGPGIQWSGLSQSAMWMGRGRGTPRSRTEALTLVRRGRPVPAREGGAMGRGGGNTGGRRVGRFTFYPKIRHI